MFISQASTLFTPAPCTFSLQHPGFAACRIFQGLSGSHAGLAWSYKDTLSKEAVCFLIYAGEWREARGAVWNVEHEGVTSGNGVLWTDRALEGLRTSRKTKSSGPLRGIRAGLGMRFRGSVCQQAQGSRVQTTALPKKNIEEQKRLGRLSCGGCYRRWRKPILSC